MDETRPLGRSEADSQPTPISRTSLTAEAVARLKRMIVEEGLAPATRLREKELSERFGISRTPLREALKILATDGLVELLPNRGAQVADVSGEAIRETFEVLAGLEGLAARLACARGTDAQIGEVRALHERMIAAFETGDRTAYFALNQAIHRAIVAMAGNAVLADMHERLNQRARFARLSANFARDRWAAAVAEHEAILAALEARDGAKLEKLMSRHIASKYAGPGAMLDPS